MLTKNYLNNIDKAYFINLSSRKDRLYHMKYSLPFHAEKFEPISGFVDNDLMSSTEQSCFATHFKIWQNIYNSNQTSVIIEDDAVFDDDFTDLWNNLYSQNLPEEYNIIYLGGCLSRNKPNYHKVLNKYNQYFFNIRKNNFFKKGHYRWHMTTLAYILTPSGAELLLNNFSQFEPVDHYIVNTISQINPEGLFHQLPCHVSFLNSKSDIKRFP